MDIQPVDILKWIGLALAAGFIGYFGRYLSMLIIEKIHKRKSELPSTNEGTVNTTTVEVESTNTDKLKLEKKRLKQKSKIAKKKKGIR
jgi:hypothetical protein